MSNENNNGNDNNNNNNNNNNNLENNGNRENNNNTGNNDNSSNENNLVNNKKINFSNKINKKNNNRINNREIKPAKKNNINFNNNLSNNDNNTLSLSNNSVDNENESNNNISHLISNNEKTNNSGKNIIQENKGLIKGNNEVIKENKGNSINEDTKKFIDNFSSKIKDISKSYLFIKKTFDETSSLIKILNSTSLILITLFFSYIYYSLYLSIIFFIISFLVLFIYDKLFAFIYLGIYVIFMTQIVNSKNNAYGVPLKVTSLNYTKTPLDCTVSSSILSVDTKELQKELQLGNTTYSFWIYVNGSNNSVNKNTWNTYRYKEWKSIMYRGDSSSQTQFPGFWLTPTLNNLVIAFQYNNSKVERIQLDNIEMNKWINITTVIENKSVSVYINGLLDRINNLDQTPPDVSPYNLYINNEYSNSTEEEDDGKSINPLSKNKNGFPGYLTNVINYNYPLSADYIKESYIYYKKMIDNYQINVDKQNNTYLIPSLITNSDIKN